MTYAVEILRAAQRQLAKVERDQQGRIIQAIRDLSANPRPPGCKKLSGRQAWRIRIGSFRVIYEVHDDRLVVLVISIGDRKEVYR